MIVAEILIILLVKVYKLPLRFFRLNDSFCHVNKKAFRHDQDKTANKFSTLLLSSLPCRLTEIVMHCFLISTFDTVNPLISAVIY